MDVCMMMTIPSDIITEILYRLPAKSVARFRCVSKGWQSLITDPKFIKTHLVTLNRNHHIFLRGYCLYSHPFHNYHDPCMFEPTKLPNIELVGQLNYPQLAFHGSCDGLVLLSVSDDDDLVLFNPTTRESVQLPRSPRYYPHLKNYDQESVRINPSTHGIAYDSVTEDYKVISLTCFQYSTDDIDAPHRYRHGRGRRRMWVTSTTVRVSIYSLRSNTWRQLVIDTPYEFRELYHQFHAVYFNGFFHWFGSKKDTHHSEALVAFSLVDECFREVPSPTFCNDTEIMSHMNCNLIVLGGKLAMYVLPDDDCCVKLVEGWLMNEYGVKESWTKLPLDIFNNEFDMVNPMIFDDNGKIRVANQSNMLIYDFEKRTFSKNVYILSRRFRPFGSYVESLVSPKRKDTSDGKQILDQGRKGQTEK